MQGLVSELQHAGWDASHRFHISERAYRGPRTRIARLWLRIRMYLCYPVSIVWHILRSPKPLIAVVCTNTFYAPLLASLVSRCSNVQVVHLVYDLFPDALLISGHVKEGSLLEKILGAITDATMRSCARNVFLGERLLEHATQRHGEIPRTAVIPVGAAGDAFADRPPGEGKTGGPVSVLYCGNLGHMHDITTFTGALREDAGDIAARIRFLFHAGGPCLPALEAQTRSLPDPVRAAIRLDKNLKHDEWVETMAAADVALVTMTPGAEKVVMPSKTYSALTAGQAILAVCPLESDLADTVARCECGWVVAPGDAAGLRRVLEEIATRPDAILEKRRNAYRAGHDHYDTKVVTKQWEALFRELESPATTPNT